MLRRQQTGFDGAPSNVLERKIDYWFGSGNHARSFISRNANGDLIELPITWYSENGGHWGMSPAYDSAQHAGFSRKITYRCMSCHNAYPTLPAQAEQGERWPEQLPEGIDCQRCHGPGQTHVETARAGKPSSIVNPKRLSAERKMEVCLQCHLETTNSPLPGSLLRRGRSVFSYRPGEPLEDYALFFDHAPGTGHDDKFEFASAPYRLKQSRCFTESRGALTCTTCHDPHGRQTASNYNAVCRSCHLAADAIHGRPVEDCVSCHMARRRPFDAGQVTISDHRIQRSGAGSFESKAGKPYRGRVVLYYPETINDAATRDSYLALAQVANQANLVEGIPSLERAIAKWKRGEFSVDLADAYRHMGERDRAVPLYREAIRLDPRNWSAYFGLGVTLRDPSALLRARTLAPWNTEIAKSLAAVLPPAEGLAVLRSAVAADPDSSDLQNNLGTTLLRLGDVAGAARALREAVRLRPEMASVRFNVATLLSRLSQWPAAKFEFEQGLRLDDASAEGHSAYGIALATRGDMAEARREFETALRLNARLTNTHYNLAVLLMNQGDTAEAEEHLLAVLRLAPDHREARAKLEALRRAKR